MVEEELESEILVCPFEERVSMGWGYWLVHAAARKPGHSLRAFRKWLLQQVRASA
jgi:hypothetical protein